MMRPVWATSLGSEFDDFLFAPIGEEANGMLLGVISALARLDLDPWQEATNLAGLPEETATERLASLIAALPGGLSAHRYPEPIAARLTALLPHRAGSDAGVRKTLVDAAAVTNLRTGIYMFLIFIVVMLATQRIVASGQPSTQADNVHVPAATAVSPEAPLPKSGG